MMRNKISKYLVGGIGGLGGGTCWLNGQCGLGNYLILDNVDLSVWLSNVKSNKWWYLLCDCVTYPLPSTQVRCWELSACRTERLKMMEKSKQSLFLISIFKIPPSYPGFRLDWSWKIPNIDNKGRRLPVSWLRVGKYGHYVYRWRRLDIFRHIWNSEWFQ